jgi:hypothetical protein
MYSYWSDPNINRGGIIPINIDNSGNIWMCFAINYYGGNLTTIGGKFDSTDGNILFTAIREFNEEIANTNAYSDQTRRINISRLITLDDIIGCHSVKSNNSIIIFAPNIMHPLMDFKRTDELIGTIWLTISQFNSLYLNREYNRDQYKLSGDLDKELGSVIINYVLNNDVFNNNIMDSYVKEAVDSKKIAPKVTFNKVIQRMVLGQGILIIDIYNNDYVVSDKRGNYILFKRKNDLVKFIKQRKNDTFYTYDDVKNTLPTLRNIISFNAKINTIVDPYLRDVVLKELLETIDFCTDIICRLSLLHQIDDLLYEEYDKKHPTAQHKAKADRLLSFSKENIYNYNMLEDLFMVEKLDSLIKRWK